jgi:hypothetical protein
LRFGSRSVSLLLFDSIAILTDWSIYGSDPIFSGDKSRKKRQEQQTERTRPVRRDWQPSAGVLEFFFIPVYKTTRLQFNAMASPVEIYGKAIFLGCRGSRENAELALREAVESTRLKTMAGGVQANTL